MLFENLLDYATSPEDAAEALRIVAAATVNDAAAPEEVRAAARAIMETSFAELAKEYSDRPLPGRA